MQKPGYFERAMARLGELDPHFVRIDHIYDYYGVYQVDESGTPLYTWDALDRIVDAILSAGADPLICISYLPQALSQGSVYAPPIDLAAWEALVYETVYHYNVERGLEIRYWEVWNEPNLPTFWNGTLDEYLSLYEATARGALRADPSIQLGGPATASLDPWLRAGTPFYERNWIAGLVRFAQERDLPLDFVSWHYYDTVPAHYTWTVEAHQGWIAGLDPRPAMLLTEWNWSASVPHREFDTGETSGYVAAVTAALADSPLEQAFFFEPMDSSTTWEGRWGLIRADGAVKPVYDTFRLLSQLTGERLAVRSDHPGAGALATRERHDILVLLWHCCSGHSTLSAELSVTGLPPSTGMTAHIYGLDVEHGNSYRGENDQDMFINSIDLGTTHTGEANLTIKLPENATRLVRLQSKRE